MLHFTVDRLNRSGRRHVGEHVGSTRAGTPQRRRAMSLPGAAVPADQRSATVTSGLAIPLTSTDCTWILAMSSRTAEVDAVSSNGSWLVLVP